MKEVEELATVSIKVKPSVHKRLKMVAAENGKSVGDVVEEMLRILNPRK